jgi:hypothetical protein
MIILKLLHVSIHFYSDFYFFVILCVKTSMSTNKVTTSTLSNELVGARWSKLMLNTLFVKVDAELRGSLVKFDDTFRGYKSLVKSS